MRNIYKNHATSLKVIQFQGGYIFFESHLPGSKLDAKVYPSRTKAIQAMQRYSKRFYGEKAK